MISINATPTKLPLSLGGNVPPYSLMTDSNVVGVEEWGLDNTKTSDGLVYPVDYDTTTQTVVDNMINRVAISGKSNNSYASGVTKRKILGRFNNGYKSLSSVVMHTPSTGATTPAVALISSVNKNVCDIGNDTVIEIGHTDIGAGNQICARAITCSGDDTLTFGNVTAVHADAPTNTEMLITKLATGKAIVVWRETTNLKAVVLTVSGQTITVKTVVTIKTDVQDANNTLIGARTIATDKFAVAYKGTTNVGCSAISIVSDEIDTVGSTVAVSTSATSFYATSQFSSNGANQMNVFKDDHFVFTYVRAFSSPNATIQSVHFSVSGTTVTEVTTYTTGANSSPANWQMPKNDDNDICFFTLRTSSTIGNYFYHYLGSDNKMYTIESRNKPAVFAEDYSYLEYVSDTQYNWLGGTGGAIGIINIVDGVLEVASISVANKITTETGIHTRTGDYYVFFSGTDVGCFKLGNEITINVNGEEVVNETLENKLVVYDLKKTVGGDKVYLDITNDDASTKNIELKAVIAGIV